MTPRPTALSVSDVAERIAAEVGRVVVGKDAEIVTAITTLLAGGHLLIEDVPGVGKTTLATAIAHSFGAKSTRIQFTSDMLPADVTGVSVLERASAFDRHAAPEGSIAAREEPGQRFRFHPGPIFANVVVADEVNRSTPKTQSSLLEAMSEGRVTVDGTTYPLPTPFMVVATQNPQDMEGTFPLPEAQRDRFMTRLSLGYPALDAEVALLGPRTDAGTLADVSAVADLGQVTDARRHAARVHLAPTVGRYLVQLVAATREHPGITHGASPRASLHLAQMARARAAIAGRDFVSPDDVASLASVVLSHRLITAGLHASAADALGSAQQAIAAIVGRTPVPGMR